MHEAKTRAFYKSTSKPRPLQGAGTCFDRKRVALRALSASPHSVYPGHPFGTLSALAMCVITSHIHLRACLHKRYWSWNRYSQASFELARLGTADGRPSQHRVAARNARCAFWSAVVAVSGLAGLKWVCMLPCPGARCPQGEAQETCNPIAVQFVRC